MWKVTKDGNAVWRLMSVFRKREAYLPYREAVLRVFQIVDDKNSPFFPTFFFFFYKYAGELYSGGLRSRKDSEEQ